MGHELSVFLIYTYSVIKSQTKTVCRRKVVNTRAAFNFRRRLRLFEF